MRLDSEVPDMPRFAFAIALALLACSGPPERAAAPPPLVIDDARLRAAADEPQSWLTYGGSYAEQRYSRLAQIDAANVKQLGLPWYFDTGLPRGHEATPIAVDGVIYTTGSWSVVFAIDARTGKLLWRHDPQVPRAAGGNACCDVVNRGVAVYRGRVYSRCGPAGKLGPDGPSATQLALPSERGSMKSSSWRRSSRRRRATSPPARAHRRDRVGAHLRGRARIAQAARSRVGRCLGNRGA
jgi:glucose dehydrogenase